MANMEYKKKRQERRKLELNQIVYLDHNATTPLDPLVLRKMMPYFTASFGNASSIDHRYGNDASVAVESARNSIAKAINAKKDEIIFTSGSTESNNLAIRGTIERHKDKDHIITCVTEHESVLETVRHLETIGKKVTYLPVDKLGMVDLHDIESAITARTAMISIMAANNEIGVISNIKEIGKVAHESNILFHTDAAQAVGNIPIDVKKMNIDLMSFSAHKMYGPKGIGALYIRGVKPRVTLNGIVYGGGQERGLRSGTLNVAGIVGFGSAVTIAVNETVSENQRLKKMSRMVLEILEYENASLNGNWDNRLAGNLNVCFPGIDGKAIINSVSDSIAISAGSACTTQSVKPSHVIMALGYGEDRAHSSIRMGFGRYTEEDDAEFGAWEITDAVRGISKINA